MCIEWGYKENSMQKLLKETIREMEKQVEEQQKIIDNLKKWIEPEKKYGYGGGIESPQPDTESKIW